MSPILWWAIPATAVACAIVWAGVRRRQFTHVPSDAQRDRQLLRLGRAIGFAEPGPERGDAPAAAAGADGDSGSRDKSVPSDPRRG